MVKKLCVVLSVLVIIALTTGCSRNEDYVEQFNDASLTKLFLDIEKGEDYNSITSKAEDNKLKVSVLEEDENIIQVKDSKQISDMITIEFDDEDKAKGILYTFTRTGGEFHIFATDGTAKIEFEGRVMGNISIEGIESPYGIIYMISSSGDGTYDGVTYNFKEAFYDTREELLQDLDSKIAE